MNAREFKIVALNLCVSGKCAADYRTSISRSYYAAFHVGLEIIKNIDKSLKKRNLSHDDVIESLSNCDDSRISAAAVQLQSLKSDRVQADYRLDNIDIEKKQKAEFVYRLADRIIQEIDSSYSNPSNRKIIESSILRYIRKFL